MKKDQYFNLEVNFLSNDNFVRMMMELDAAQSLGIYMMLLTHLRKADNYEAVSYTHLDVYKRQHVCISSPHSLRAFT